NAVCRTFRRVSPCFAQNGPASIEERIRILCAAAHPAPAHIDTEVQMGRRGDRVTGVTDRADDFARKDEIAGAHELCIEMRVVQPEVAEERLEPDDVAAAPGRLDAAD